MTARDGFAQVLRGELTKLVTVRSTVWCVLATIGLTILLTTLATSSPFETTALPLPAFERAEQDVEQV